MIRRWKHLSVLTDQQQQDFLTVNVIERARRQLGLFMVILTVVTIVIIALIIYTLTMDKIREIATLRLIGASNRTIVSLILQQALLMGLISYVAGTAMVYVFKGWFPRRIVMLPEDIAALFGVVVIVCLLASVLEIFLYDWWPLARRRDLYRRLSTAAVEPRPYPMAASAAATTGAK